MNDGDMKIGTDYWAEGYTTVMTRREWLSVWPKHWTIKEEGDRWEKCPCGEQMKGARLTKHHPLNWVHYECALEEWIETRELDQLGESVSRAMTDRAEREWSGGNEALAVVKLRGRQGKSADVMYDGSRTIQQGRYGVKTS